MEKIILRPQSNEIVVNNGATDGAVDLFCYTPDDALSAPLGALYVIGHRESDSANIGYIVSLIAALARREYYVQPACPAREAFARTLRKANEVVEEFFRTGDVKLSVGIVAVAGGQIMVSKLDKFKILLARDNQVIDILSNVLLFSKEHTEKRRFSSIIHGSIQAGDRILAFVPTRAVTTRERNLRTWFLNCTQNEFAQHVSQLGAEHATFATAMVHIDIAQESEPAVMPSPQPPELSPPVVVVGDGSPINPSLVAQPSPSSSATPLTWSPRQQSTGAPDALPGTPVHRDAPHVMTADVEAPRLIPTEFSLGTRRTTLSRWLGRFRILRLDTRGKAITLAVVAAIIAGGVLTTRSLFIDSPHAQQDRQALERIRMDIDRASAKNDEGDRREARSILARAMDALDALGLSPDDTADLSAAIVSALDSVDGAHPVEPRLLASPAPDSDVIRLAVWASPSQSLRVAGTTAAGMLWVATLRDGSTQERAEFGATPADAIVGWRGSALAVNYGARTVSRIVAGEVKSYVIPVQETILDAAEFADNLYVLTDRTILKVSDLDTDKPVTKRWLEEDSELLAGASRLYVDGSIYVMNRDGELATYFKSKEISRVTVPLSPSGIWKLIPWSGDRLAVPIGDARRVYVIDPASGSLTETLKIDSQIPFTVVGPGPDLSALLLTSEGKVWQVK